MTNQRIGSSGIPAGMSTAALELPQPYPEARWPDNLGCGPTARFWGLARPGSPLRVHVVIGDSAGRCESWPSCGIGDRTNDASRLEVGNDK
jgi:hypothetical protein